jgi:uncharacterized protein YcbX
MTVMKIDSLWRYPIKGLSAERLASIDVEAGQGFALDRVYAVTDGSFIFDGTNPVPMAKTHFPMLARFERLAILKTRFDPETHQLEVKAPDAAHYFALREIDGRKALAAFLTGFVRPAPSAERLTSSMPKDTSSPMSASIRQR